MKTNTDKKKKKEKLDLLSLHETLMATMGQSQAGIALADEAGQIVYINDAGLEVGGKKKKELAVPIGEYVESWDLYHFDGVRLREDEVPLVRAIKFQEVNSLEFLVKRKDGDIVVLTNAAPILDESGRLLGGVAIFLDITARRVAEERLADSEKKRSIWLDCSPVCTKIVDLDLNLRYMSAAGVEQLKIDDITQYYGKPYPFSFYPDSFRKPMIKNLEAAKATGRTVTQEADVVDVDGNKLWYHSTIVPIKDEKGRVEYMVVVSVETTERKRIEEEKDSLAKFPLENPNPVIRAKNDGTILFSNHAGLELLHSIGCEKDLFVSDYFRSMLEEAFSTFKEITLDVNISDRIFSFSTTAVLEENYANLYGKDITERKKGEIALAESKKALEKKNEVLRDVLEQLTIEKKNIMDDVAANAENLLLPLVEKLRAKGASKKFADLLKKNIQEITIPFGRKLVTKNNRLSPREIEVCNMIRNGMVTKEIAAALNISIRAVEKYRYTLRKKLDLTGEKANLMAYLMNI